MSIILSNTNAYSPDQPLAPLPPMPIPAQADPTADNFAPAGSIWLNTLTPSAFINAGTVNGQAQWITVGGLSGTFTNITVSNSATIGGILSANGGINTNGQDIVTGAGDISATSGNITSANGNVGTVNGDLISVGGNVRAGGYVRGNTLIAVADATSPTGSDAYYTNVNAAVTNPTPATADRSLKIYIGNVPYFLPLYASLT